MVEKVDIDGIIAYLKERKENIEYNAERVSGWMDVDIQEVKEINHMLSTLKKVKEVV